MTITHVPVLAGELIEMLDPAPGDLAVDCTFGGGGHATMGAPGESSSRAVSGQFAWRQEGPRAFSSTAAGSSRRA